MNTESNPKKVLVIHYSQSGQLNRLVQAVCTPLLQDKKIKVDFLNIEPEIDYPFPWPFFRFQGHNNQ